ncbi:hypothetical protein HYH03_009603 [Edaphochlamys debaryana]|uniref:Uncharacterized protein n=1 Tax=Edaphochlamys debaryana TaxID=47281 RepID=A0A835XYT6_9CHLO|nr:hypothetical protein HYH03_009603 [Edaphochlamys debaryana]|eukprot:KAG2492112.1 hypothetical protein HYH03_009603 [Edaphochlamys debaryana]
MESNASTAVLATQGLMHSYSSSSMQTHIYGGSGSAAGHSQEPVQVLAWDAPEPSLAHALDGAALRQATAVANGAEDVASSTGPAVTLQPGGESHVPSSWQAGAGSSSGSSPLDHHAMNGASLDHAAPIHATSALSAAVANGAVVDSALAASASSGGSLPSSAAHGMNHAVLESPRDASHAEASTSAASAPSRRRLRLPVADARDAGPDSGGDRALARDGAATPQPVASTSAPESEHKGRRRLLTPAGRGRGRGSAAPAPAPAKAFAPAPAPQLPPYPRLKPAPSAMSWPDYPYTRRPTTSACARNDVAALKLEALFQSVLNYPRVPPRLLRFLRRLAPGGVEGSLADITATVETLSAAVGREVAIYLIRRRAWVVLVPAGSISVRLETVRRLLGLGGAGPSGSAAAGASGPSGHMHGQGQAHGHPSRPGSSVPGPHGASWSGVPVSSELLDLLRKNPNLLRLDRATLLMRYEALHDSIGFTPEQVRALVMKYPLILNFHPNSVYSAANALRRLCSARPAWAALHEQLSPSQFAFYMRDRLQVLLRLEYLLLTGGGGTWTLRDIMKTSSNVFKKVHGGFRNWSTERLRRLRERIERARAEARAEGRLTDEEDEDSEQAALVEAEAKAVYAAEENRRFHDELIAKRQAERSEAIRRDEQRQEALAKITAANEAAAQAAAVEAHAAASAAAGARRRAGARLGESWDEEDEAEEAGLQRRWRLGDAWADHDHDHDEPGPRMRWQPPAGGPARGDPLASVTPGRAWSRPMQKVPRPFSDPMLPSVAATTASAAAAAQRQRAVAAAAAAAAAARGEAQALAQRPQAPAVQAEEPGADGR